MNLAQIQHFIAAAGCLNFTEAAKKLFISQPTLSNSIAAFEKELGFPLFIRTKRFVRLTPAGAVLLNEFNGLTSQINASVEKARKANLGIEGTISIGCLEAIDTSLFLPQIISSFTEKYPNIEFSLERHGFRGLREKLQSGYFDLIFTLSFEQNAMPGTHWETICCSQGVIAIPSSNPLSHRDSLELSDIKDETICIISPSESQEGAQALFNLCRSNGFNPNKIKYCSSLESLLLYLESGFGVALLDRTIKFREDAKIKFFDVPNDFGNINVVFAWNDKNQSPSLTLFLNALMDMPAKALNLFY